MRTYTEWKKQQHTMCRVTARISNLKLHGFMPDKALPDAAQHTASFRPNSPWYATCRTTEELFGRAHVVQVDNFCLHRETRGLEFVFCRANCGVIKHKQAEPYHTCCANKASRGNYTLQPAISLRRSQLGYRKLVILHINKSTCTIPKPL